MDLLSTPTHFALPAAALLLSWVLQTAGIRVITWREGALPTIAEVRHALAALIRPGEEPARVTPSRPMPLIPVPEMAELLAAGDCAAFEADLDAGMEPVASAFFDEIEAGPARH